MQTAETIKNIVREKYAEIANQDKALNETTCCGSGAAGGTYTIMADSYANLPGYNPDADLGLGCGLPTEFAHIEAGDTVLDLGSGAGNDAFVARAETGAEGKVIGVDFTPAMIQKARANADKLGFNNVEFRQGDIEDLPVSDNSVDVVVSNCVLNLVPDKTKVFNEIARVLRPGGHFSISDVVLVGELPDSLRNAAEMYAGCVSGAIQMDDYLKLARKAGFENVTVQKQKPILIPDNILLEYLTAEQLKAFVASGTGIFSVTVYAEKPGEKRERAAKPKVSLQKLALKEACCGTDSGCC
ncbi:MAG: methyltransferase domain-containing protein [Haliscomenobacteraceae bacterium CHB4]|nr:Arsenite methyltransferase [Saprospiraceae bacterium]MCE7926045.1 methyltransferase domain-containing protein [Haliscomenobacteraceae bacterium CHB4]